MAYPRPRSVQGAFRRCRSSVVEHSLGKGEVDSSILSGSTILPRPFGASGRAFWRSHVAHRPCDSARSSPTKNRNETRKVALFGGQRGGQRFLSRSHCSLSLNSAAHSSRRWGRSVGTILLVCAAPLWRSMVFWFRRPPSPPCLAWPGCDPAPVVRQVSISDERIRASTHELAEVCSPGRCSP